MGRFDILTELEENPIQAPPGRRDIEIPASPQTVLPASPQKENSGRESGLSSKSPQAGKPANLQVVLSENEQVEKYTTRLEPGLVKKIKLYAVEHDMNDYDVIRTAVKKLLAEET